jgi:hypothetical protein
MGSDAPAAPDARMNHFWNYGYPTVPNQRFDGENALEWINGEYLFDWTFSWEQHDAFRYQN